MIQKTSAYILPANGNNLHTDLNALSACSILTVFLMLFPFAESKARIVPCVSLS
jgi:hypothetical protein